MKSGFSRIPSSAHSGWFDSKIRVTREEREGEEHLRDFIILTIPSVANRILSDGVRFQSVCESSRSDFDGSGCGRSREGVWERLLYFVRFLDALNLGELRIRGRERERERAYRSDGGLREMSAYSKARISGGFKLRGRSEREKVRLPLVAAAAQAERL